MDKKIVFLSVLTFAVLFSAASALAQLPVVPAAASAASAQAKVGIVAAVQGSVQLTTPGQVGRIAGSGQPVFLGDEVKTDEAGRLQVLLLDETVFTIGPNSAIVIDKFVYDPSTQDGELKASIVKGTFRFVTGKIARKKPSQMTVDLPAGTIGIRGTMVIGHTQGSNTQAALMGPGANNNAGYAGGGFYMGNFGPDGQWHQTDVNQPGFGAQIPGDGQGPSGAFFFGDDLLNQWLNALNSNPGGGGGGGAGGGNGGSGGGGGSATDDSGQGTAGGGDFANNLGQVSGFTGELGDESNRTSQYIGDNAVSGVLDGIATYDQLRTLSSQNSGWACWSQNDVKLYNGGSDSGYSYDLRYYISYGGGYVGGPGSTITLKSGSTSDPISLGSRDFNSGTGNASFTYDGIQSSSLGLNSGQLNLQLNNVSGVIANTATHSLKITAGSTTHLSGGGTTGASEPSSDPNS